MIKAKTSWGLPCTYEDGEWSCKDANVATLLNRAQQVLEDEVIRTGRYIPDLGFAVAQQFDLEVEGGYPCDAPKGAEQVLY